MKTVWLRKEGAGELLLFFSGWGMDHRIAAYLLHESLAAGFSQDMLACYDYHTLECEPGFMNGISSYGCITVVAWSFGVWAAQHTELPPIGQAVAINGTVHPVDAGMGISPEVFRATLSTYCEENRHRFNRRMCGTGEVLELFSRMSPDRETSDQLTELEQLQKQLLSRKLEKSAAWHYNHAVIGGRDCVFPPQQQFHAWKGVPQTVIADMPHFPFFHFRNLQEVLACCRK
jgi:biotin synthesis protein BioG